MTYLLLILTLVFYVGFTVGQKSCTTPRGERGWCSSISNCSNLLKDISRANLAEPKILTISFCGSDVVTKSVQVCCPLNRCNTPEGTQGTCVKFESCPRLMNMLVPHPTIAAFQHIGKYICDHLGGKGVCCDLQTSTPNSISVSVEKVKKSSGRSTPRPTDPRDRCYEVDGSSNNKVVEPTHSPPQSESCMFLENCNSLKKYQSNPTPTEQRMLQDAWCGYKDGLLMVYCPPDFCTTLDGTQGTCVEINSCPHLAEMLRSNSSTDKIQYMQNYGCGEPDKQTVCCGPQLTPSTDSFRTKEIETCQQSATPPDPNGNCCGRNDRLGNRILYGEATDTDEYPWMALIEYKNHSDNTIILQCGGALLSGQHVLTAGHCVAGSILDTATPINVRLGEYNTTNSGPDCKLKVGGGCDYTEGALTVPIADITPHPHYNRYDRQIWNDIALIKLKWIVQYTEFIQPVCLPTSDFGSVWSYTQDLYTAGWGRTERQKWSEIKQKVNVPYVLLHDCQMLYNLSVKDTQLWDGQICAGGDGGRDFCNGDSGSPLTRIDGDRHILVGVASFGATTCGTDVPGVYSKTFYYLSWIKGQMSA